MQYEFKIDEHDKDYRCVKCGGKIPHPTKLDGIFWDENKKFSLRGMVKCEDCGNEQIVRVLCKCTPNVTDEVQDEV